MNNKNSTQNNMKLSKHIQQVNINMALTFHSLYNTLIRISFTLASLSTSTAEFAKESKSRAKLLLLLNNFLAKICETYNNYFKMA